MSLRNAFVIIGDAEGKSISAQMMLRSVFVRTKSNLKREPAQFRTYAIQKWNINNQYILLTHTHTLLTINTNNTIISLSFFPSLLYIHTFLFYATLSVLPLSLEADELPLVTFEPIAYDNKGNHFKSLSIIHLICMEINWRLSIDNFLRPGLFSNGTLVVVLLLLLRGLARISLRLRVLIDFEILSVLVLTW